MTIRILSALKGVFPAAVAALLLLLCACSEPAPRREARIGAVVTSEKTEVPTWFKIRFKLLYTDGRVYEGECRWPPDYDPVVAFDVKAAEGAVKPGRTLTSIREVEGPRAKEFIPHGRGVMRYRDGRVQDGTWIDGKFAGRL